jgi:hypothetical protein
MNEIYQSNSFKAMKLQFQDVLTEKGINFYLTNKIYSYFDVALILLGTLESIMDSWIFKYVGNFTRITLAVAGAVGLSTASLASMAAAKIGFSVACLNNELIDDVLKLTSGNFIL